MGGYPPLIHINTYYYYSKIYGFGIVHSLKSWVSSLFSQVWGVLMKRWGASGEYPILGEGDWRRIELMMRIKLPRPMEMIIQWPFQDPIDWRYLPHIRPMFQAYVIEYPHNIWSYMVQYPHFRILKFRLLKGFGLIRKTLSSGNSWSVSAWFHSLIDMD